MWGFAPAASRPVGCARRANRQGSGPPKGPRSRLSQAMLSAGLNSAWVKTKHPARRRAGPGPAYPPLKVPGQRSAPSAKILAVGAVAHQYGYAVLRRLRAVRQNLLKQPLGLGRLPKAWRLAEVVHLGGLVWAEGFSQAVGHRPLAMSLTSGNALLNTRFTQCTRLGALRKLAVSCSGSRYTSPSPWALTCKNRLTSAARKP